MGERAASFTLGAERAASRTVALPAPLGASSPG
jgi:hypothetical protein